MFLILSVSLLAFVSADITSVPVQRGDCVCANTNVNARENAGTDYRIVVVIGSGACGTFYGGKNTVGGYTWFQIKYGSDIVWVAGRYLDTSLRSRCASVSNSSCSLEQKAMACKLMEKARANILRLARVHPSGIRDTAYAWNNIDDMCNGGMAARSSYRCSECNTGSAPGGYTCLTKNVLSYLQKLAETGTVNVNELAGACHSCTSRHYKGQAADLDDDQRWQEYMSRCSTMGGLAINETTHIHCQFYD